jgi:tetratricopeptide (TPR) repeat protein
LAAVNTYLGELLSAREASAQALALAHRSEDQRGKKISLVRQAWVSYLEGDLSAAAESFQKAEALERQIDPTKLYLYGNPGAFHADHLRRAGHPDSAREITETNLQICESNRWTTSLSRCRRLLGDLAADAGENQEALEHYHAALNQARTISKRDVLIEVLLARGRWLARRGEVDEARRDLEEALDYATAGSYRLYEADIRVGLAWAHLKAGDPASAGAEAGRALALSAQTGYYWGRVDAQEVLDALKP